MTRQDDTRLYMDGQWQDRDDAARIPVIDPYLESEIGHIAAGTAQDVDLTVAAARGDNRAVVVVHAMGFFGKVQALVRHTTIVAPGGIKTLEFCNSHAFSTT